MKSNRRMALWFCFKTGHLGLEGGTGLELAAILPFLPPSAEIIGTHHQNIENGFCKIFNS